MIQILFSANFHTVRATLPLSWSVTRYRLREHHARRGSLSESSLQANCSKVWKYKNISHLSTVIQQQSFSDKSCAFRIAVQDFSLVARLTLLSSYLKGAHAVDREHRTMTALGSYNSLATSTSTSSIPFPVPKTILYCSDCEIIGTPFFCYEYVHGRFFKSPQMQTVR